MTNQNKTSRPTGTVGSCFFESAGRRVLQSAAVFQLLQNVHAKLTNLPIAFCQKCDILRAYKRRKEVIANMAYRFTGIDVDDMIYCDDWLPSDR